MTDIPPVDRSKQQLTDGSPVPADRSHTSDRGDGQQRGYVVLSPEERAKGFVKPVRLSYVHIGPPEPPRTLRNLTPVELNDHGKYGYVKFEEYGPERSPITGKYWTQKELDRAGKHCGVATTMGVSLAQTYARDPNFYSGTFCCGCNAHFPLNEFIWEPDGEPMDPDLQEAWNSERTVRVARERQEYRQRRIIELKRELEQLEKEAP